MCRFFQQPQNWQTTIGLPFFRIESTVWCYFQTRVSLRWWRWWWHNLLTQLLFFCWLAGRWVGRETAVWLKFKSLETVTSHTLHFIVCVCMCVCVQISGNQIRRASSTTCALRVSEINYTHTHTHTRTHDSFVLLPNKQSCLRFFVVTEECLVCRRVYVGVTVTALCATVSFTNSNTHTHSIWVPREAVNSIFLRRNLHCWCCCLYVCGRCGHDDWVWLLCEWVYLYCLNRSSSYFVCFVCFCTDILCNSYCVCACLYTAQRQQQLKLDASTSRWDKKTDTNLMPCSKQLRI